MAKHPFTKLLFPIILFILARVPLSHLQGELPTEPDVEPIPAKYRTGYRTVSWCVSGKDEPELHEWPYSQFAPLLRRWNRVKHDSNVRYDLHFNSIETQQKDVGDDGRLFKAMHVVFKAEKLREPVLADKQIWEPTELEGLIIQANSNPYALALPTGQFSPPGDLMDMSRSEIHCKDCKHERWANFIACRKRAKIHVEHPTILAWHYLQPSFNYSPTTAPTQQDKNDNGEDALPPVPTPARTDGKQTEVHGNFRFYSPRCASTRRLMFTILVVRSFVKHEYDVFHRGPYRVTVREHSFQSDIHPSPFFYHFSRQALCHTYSSSDITLEEPRKHKDFEMNHLFDCCVREEENRKTKVTTELLKIQFQRTTSCYEKLYKKQTGTFDPRTIETGQESFVCFFPYIPKQCDLDPVELPIEEYPPCEPCKQPITTTTEKVTEKPHSVYKRTLHGGLMIMTNFCLQPIVIYIARFYKETFNSSTYKGAKSWYLMHLLGGMISSSMVYLGYFSGSGEDNIVVRSHIGIGKVYICTLAVCYLTAWGRNKNHLVTAVAEFVHGCLGYVTISLALVSIMTAPALQYTSKLFVALMMCTQGFFMVILTCHICFLDKKFGMRPKRRHFPTVEARFDEIAVPGSKFRILMLFIFSIITFSLSTASTFVE